MKKILLILSFFLLISCNTYVMTNIHERIYIDQTSAIKDVYTQLRTYDMDSIPIHKWINNVISEDTIQIEQHILRKVIDKHTNYVFVFTEYIDPRIECAMCPEKIKYFQFVIRYQGK